MSGRLLLEGEAPPPVHYCDPRGWRCDWFVSGHSIPLQHPEVRRFEGALWECDCGQAWHCRGLAWYPASQRQARKILKRAARQ